VQDVEPGCLTKVRALTTYLKGKPLIAEVFLLERIEAKDVLCVVLLDKVLNDGTAFPKSEASVQILNS
jgi:hypothetical protein